MKAVMKYNRACARYQTYVVLTLIFAAIWFATIDKYLPATIASVEAVIAWGWKNRTFIGANESVTETISGDAP